MHPSESGEADDFVVVTAAWHLSLDDPYAEVVLSASAFDADLGMPTRGSVLRQLRVDVPRCEVTIDGRAARSGDEVFARSHYPRLCTQAVLAPAVEWLHRAGAVAHEDGAARPMVVRIAARQIEVRKDLGLRDLDGNHPLGRVRLRVAVLGEEAVVSVTIVRSLPVSLSPPSRGADAP